MQQAGHNTAVVFTSLPCRSVGFAPAVQHDLMTISIWTPRLNWRLAVQRGAAAALMLPLAA